MSVDFDRAMKMGLERQYGKPDRFEGRQNRFLEAGAKIVEKGAAKIQGTIADKGDPVALFHSLTRNFANERRDIAVKEGTEAADQFGTTYRDNMDGGYYPYTPLVGVYTSVGLNTLKNLHGELSTLKRSKTEFQETTKKVEERVHGRIYSTTYEILGPRDVAKWAHDIPKEATLKFKAQLQKEEKKSQSGEDDSNISQELSKSRESFRHFGLFKKSNPELYKQGRMHFHLKNVVTEYPSPVMDRQKKEIVSGNRGFLKSDYVLVTMRTQLLDDTSGKIQMLASNQLLTWMYRNFDEDPVDRMLKVDTPIVVLSQDIYLIDKSLNECALLFKEILSWDPSRPLNELKEKVAELRYIFAQSMPYQRGSAAVGEWLEKSIYRQFGFECDYQPAYPKDSVDTAAVTSLTYSQYLKRYEKLVQLKVIGG